MKKIAIFIGVFGFFGATMAQNNFIPGLSPSPGDVAFGLPGAPVSGHLFQLHGVYDYCISIEPQGGGSQVRLLTAMV